MCLSQRKWRLGGYICGSGDVHCCNHKIEPYLTVVRHHGAHDKFFAAKCNSHKQTKHTNSPNLPVYPSAVAYLRKATHST